MNNGLFISFEGPEGSGKSTITKKIYEWLTNLSNDNKINYKKVILTREPGGYNNNLSEDIRKLIFSNKYDIPHLTEALLFAAARSSHVINTILPALNKNYIIVCDRYIDSSYVYQGFVNNLNINDIIAVNNIATLNIKPNITIVLMIDAQTGLNRIFSNNRETNKIDLKGIEYHQKVVNYYHKLSEFNNDNRIKYVDTTNKSIDDVFNECQKLILKYIYENSNY